jgi:hypothetical protein
MVAGYASDARNDRGGQGNQVNEESPVKGGESNVGCCLLFAQVFRCSGVQE